MLMCRSSHWPFLARTLRARLTSDDAGGDLTDAAADEPGRPVPGGGVRPDLRARGRPRRLRPRHRARRPARDGRHLPARQRAHPPAAAVPLAAGRGPARARPPVLDRGPRLRPRLPHPRLGRAAARRRPPAGRDRRADLRAPARPHPAAVGAVPDPRPAGRPRRAADQGPPLRRRRRVGQRDPRRAARPQPRGPRDAAGRRRQGRRARAGRAGDARPRADGPPDAAAARAALGPDRDPEPDRAAGRERLPRRPHVLARRGGRPPPARPRAQGPGDPRGDDRPPAADVVQRPHLRPPPLLVRRSSRSTPSRRSRTRPA